MSANSPATCLRAVSSARRRKHVLVFKGDAVIDQQQAHGLGAAADREVQQLQRRDGLLVLGAQRVHEDCSEKQLSRNNQEQRGIAPAASEY